MIRPHSLDETTTERIQQLIRAAFSGRDDMYAAADTIDNERLADICRKLAQELGGNAAELQQLVKMQGRDPAEPETVASRLQRVVLAVLKEQRGNQAVVAEAESTHHDVKQKYDEVIQATPNKEVKGVLQRHREHTQFGEDVLHEIRSTD